ncbi:MAG: protein translocase subunit SecF [Actinomycetota bacterium]
MRLHEAVGTFRGHRVPHLRIIEHKNWWFAISGILIVLSLLGLFVRGLNLSIDFEGGAQLQYPDNAGVTADQVLSTMAKYGRGDAEVQVVGGTTISIRTSTLTTLGEKRGQLIDALATQAGDTPADVNVTDVGPTWGAQISKKMLEGLIIFLILVTVYIAFRFEWKMAISAQAALLHDLIITAGIYALVGREVTPETIIAILTILGYSLYDTVVIFDKIQENTESLALVTKDTYSGVVNLSLNQTLMRSVNTSLVVLLPIVSLLFFGGDTLKNFAFALFIGVTSGAYSSIFVASPILATLKEREPRYQQIRAKAQRQPGGKPALRSVKPSATAPAAEADEELAPTSAAAVSNAAATRVAARQATAQRPRPKKKKTSAKQRRRR